MRSHAEVRERDSYPSKRWIKSIAHQIQLILACLFLFGAMVVERVNICIETHLH